ncbi:MAG: S8 family serine peptidase [Rikenellaceae bacterium]|jgi:subtilisin family serine protease|nr:S8 family serine peptidase [Rikenellaceae bacterium]
MKNISKRIFALAALCTAALLFVFSGCADDPLENNLENSDELTIATRGGDGGSPYYFYDHEGEKIYLSLNTEHAFFSAVEPRLSADITQRGDKAVEFQSDNGDKKQHAGKQGVNRYSTELSFEKGLSDEQYLELLADIGRQNKDVLVAPYFNDQYGSKIGLSNFFYVKLKDENDVALLEKTATQYDCVIVSQDEFMPLWFTLSVTEASELTALESANLFHESGLFVAGEPDLMADIALSNDLYYAQQWGLKNTGQYGGMSGVDIKAEQAWPISTGQNIIVALIDQGVDLDHPDLVANKHSLSFDCQTGGTALQSIRGNHGTAVAGIIGAVMNNTSGIAGVAPNCKLMSISHSLSSSVTNIRQQLAAGINWAWQKGAHVINCSWGHQTALSGSYITDAINNATTKGRGNKGCVVVFSSGNDLPFTTVKYPATLPNVIAVGAVDRTGTRSIWNSSQASNYGPELDVVAPGTDIYTTDRQGSVGYTSGNYDPSFGGTSAAAPHVAGVAALILSEYPDLTSSEVRYRIVKTAQKLPSYAFTNPYTNPPGTLLSEARNAEVGYGLVNAYAALSPVPYVLYFELINANEQWKTFLIEIQSTDGGLLSYQDSFTLSTNQMYTARYDLFPGNFRVSAYAETDFVDCEYNFTVVKGGSLRLSYFGNSNTPPYWGSPWFTSN